jgi:hypothetical protein
MAEINCRHAASEEFMMQTVKERPDRVNRMGAGEAVPPVGSR